MSRILTRLGGEYMGKRVLLIEDEPNIIEAIKFILSRDGFQVMSHGDGATALQKIRALGNDMALDPGIGVCGKQGQGVPVGVGQPTTRIDGVTIGGTQA